MTLLTPPSLITIHYHHQFKRAESTFRFVYLTNKTSPSNEIHCRTNHTRRIFTSTPPILAISTLLLLLPTANDNAHAFDFRMTTPDQTIEEAKASIGGHARALTTDVKELIEIGEWKEAQKVLRKNAAYLKQDVYTIIQNKPGEERPNLRKMYSTLFNNVTRLDYAARDRNEELVWQLYGKVVVALADILSTI